LRERNRESMCVLEERGRRDTQCYACVSQNREREVVLTERACDRQTDRERER